MISGKNLLMPDNALVMAGSVISIKLGLQTALCVIHPMEKGLS